MESAGNVPDVERPIFIVGTGRSGTTLLRSLLSAHSRIAVTPETHFMKWADRNGLLGDGEDFDRVWEEYTQTWRFESLDVSAEDCCQIAKGLEGVPARTMFLAMLAAYGKRLEKPRVGEKSPSHVRYLDHLLGWYPDARVIVTQRDPRAVLASKLRNPWVTSRLTPPSVRGGLLVASRVHAIVREAYDWARVHQQIVPRWKDDPRVYVVAYESLVRDPEREVRMVFDLLEEAFEPTVLTDRSSEKVVLPSAGAPDDELKDWGQEHHQKTLRPISEQSLDKWKTELSPSEVALVEGVCEGGMVRTGYVPSTPSFRRAAGRSLARGVIAGEAAEASVQHKLRTLRRRADQFSG